MVVPEHDAQGSPPLELVTVPPPFPVAGIVVVTVVVVEVVDTDADTAKGCDTLIVTETDEPAMLPE